MSEELTRFVESYSSDSAYIKKAEPVSLKEALQKLPLELRESAGDSAESWWVPISYYEKLNKNNRNYGKKLWENVRDKQRDTWLGSACLGDHPGKESDGDPKNICGVWLDMKLGESSPDGSGIVYGLLCPCGRLGEDLTDYLRKGGRVGTSSSGYGRLLSDGVTVDPDNYLIERLADWVLNPSQGTYFKYEKTTNGVVNACDSVRESVELPIQNEKQGERKIMTNFSKLEEKSFRKNMELFLEDADKIKDPQRKLSEFEEIESFFEEGMCPDLKERVEAKIAEQKAYIQKALQEKEIMIEEFGISGTEDLKEKLTKISEDVDAAKADAQDWRAISEKLQEKLVEATKTISERPTDAFVEYQNLKIERLLKEAKEKDLLNEKVNKKLETAVKSFEESKKSLADTTEKYEKVLQEQRAEILKKNQALKESEKKYRKLAKCLEESENLFDEYTRVLEEKSTPVYKMSPADKIAQHVNLRESQAVDNYYRKLVTQYGSGVKKFEESLRSCKTLEDAKSTFIRKVFPLL